MFELKTYLSAKQKEVNDAIDRFLRPEHSRSARVYEAMRHSLLAGGKRIRPILLMASADAVAGHHDQAMAAAVAMEMIHTYSLIHDDLPGVDNAALRRGRPSCHTAFDEATAIFAGDALQTLAFQVLAAPDPSGADPETRLACIRIIAAATGNTGMIEGQMRDMLTPSQAPTLAELRRLQELKTGALITAAVHVGALLGGAQEDQIQSLTTYADKIGLAFQIADDLLDIQGDPALMGKATGGDARDGKTTFPGLLGIGPAEALARDLVRDSRRALSAFGNNADPLRWLADFIIERHF